MTDTSLQGMDGLPNRTHPAHLMCQLCLRTPVRHLSGPYTSRAMTAVVVIARSTSTKQSRVRQPRKPGLLRFARNDGSAVTARPAIRAPTRAQTARRVIMSQLISTCHVGQMSRTFLRVSAFQEGRLAIVTSVGPQMRWT